MGAPNFPKPPSASIAFDPFPCHLFQLAGSEEYPQELDKPAQFRPHPPAGPHEIPNIEKALCHLIQGLLAIAGIGLLQDSLAYKPGQLRRNGTRLKPSVRSEEHTSE